MIEISFDDEKYNNTTINAKTRIFSIFYSEELFQRLFSHITDCHFTMCQSAGNDNLRDNSLFSFEDKSLTIHNTNTTYVVYNLFSLFFIVSSCFFHSGLLVNIRVLVWKKCTFWWTIISTYSIRCRV